MEGLYEILSLRYSYLPKYNKLWDLISRHYRGLGEVSKALLDETFGIHSKLRTANYGQVMRWISVEVKDLREACPRDAEYATPRRYEYVLKPESLAIIDGFESRHPRIDAPWDHSPFEGEMRGWGYKPEEVAFVDPKTNEVVDINELKNKADKNVFSGNYTKVVIAVRRETTVDVSIDRKECGCFWGTNVTIRDLKKKFNIEHLELFFNGHHCDDHSTLYSPPRRRLDFMTHKI